MAEFLIRVKVDPSGAAPAAAAVGRELDRAKSKADDLGAALKQAFGIYAVASAAQTVLQIADSYTALQNRLRTVSSSQENLNGLTAATFRIAQETRTAWEDVAGMYSRVARNAANLGYSQTQLITFQKALNQAVKIGGATSMEASAGLVQLSQGIASGTLRGDELRSVLEQLPTVADTIAKHMGVTRGELRALGKQGQITGRQVVDAFLEASQSLDKEFGQTVPTLADQMVMLKNAAILFFGETGSGSGTLGALGTALGVVTKHFDVLGKTVIAVGQLVGVYLAVTMIGKLIAGLQALAVAAAANPFTAILYALTAIILAVRQFGDDIELLIPVVSTGGDEFVTLGDALRVVWGELKALGSAIVDFVSYAWGMLQSTFSAGLETDGIELSLSDALRMFMSFVYSAVSILKNFKDVLTVVFGAIPVALVEAFANAFPEVVKILEDIVNKVIDVVNGIKAVGEVGNVGSVIARGAKSSQTSELNRQQLALQNTLNAGIRPQDGQKLTVDDMVKINNRIQEIIVQRQRLTNEIAAIDNKLRGIGKNDIVHVELDKEAIKGAGDQARQLAKETIEKIQLDTLVSLSEFDKKMQQEADKRLASRKKTTIGEDTGDPRQAPSMTDAELRKLQNELNQIISQSNPIEAAILKIGHAWDVLHRALAAGLISWEDFSRIIDDTMNKFKEETQPYETFIAKLHEEQQALIDLMNGKEAQSEVDKEFIKIRQQMIDKGVTWNSQMEEETKGILRMNEGYKKTIEVLKEQREQRERERKQYEKDMEKYHKEMDKFRAENTIAGGIKAGASTARDEIFSVGKDVSNVLTGMTSDMVGMVNEFIKTGEVNWQDFVYKILLDIEKILLKLALIEIISFAGGAKAGPAAPAAPGAAANFASQVAISRTTGSTGFRAGSGPVSSPGVGSSARTAPGGGGPAVVNLRNINVTDPRAAIGAVDSPAGEKVVVNMIRRNSGLIRGITGNRRH